jgi:hypothetical protein
VAGVGPFPATVDAVEAASGGLAVTLTVRNEGAAGQTTCRVSREDAAGGGAVVLAPRLEAGEQRTFQRTVTELGTTVRPLVVSCRTP